MTQPCFIFKPATRNFVNTQLTTAFDATEHDIESD